MFPGRGKSAGEPKKWKKRYYCAHGMCTNNTRDVGEDIILLPFPKPFRDYLSSLYDPSIEHNIVNCLKCSKVKKWMHLCKRGDAKFKHLSDITSNTYICNQHFQDRSGPTESHPDPFAADKKDSLVNVERSRSRKRPLERNSSVPLKRTKPETRNEISVELCDDEHLIVSETDDTFAANSLPAQTPAAQDHDYSTPSSVTAPPTSEEQRLYVNVAQTIFAHNLMCKFDHEAIRVMVQEEVCCCINRDYTINISVLGQDIDENHAVWLYFPKTIDPTQSDYINILKQLQEQWQVCKFFLISKVASEFCNLKLSDIANEEALDAMKRVKNCKILNRQEVCTACKKTCAAVKKIAARRAKKQLSKAKNHSKNVKYFTRHEALDCVRETRRSLHLEKRKTARLRKKMGKLIDKRGVALTTADNEDFLKILTSAEDEGGDKGNKIDLTKLFFQEQIKAAKARSPKGHRWHPLLLKWCLYLKTKSSSTYSALRNVITLPSEKRLYEIQAHTHIRPGFQDDVLASLVEEFNATGPETHKRYCSLLYDEIKIQEDLIYKTSTNELIGFVHLSTVDQLLAEISSETSGTKTAEPELASHILQIMVRGITTPILVTFAYFATRTLQARQLFTILIEATEILERKDIRVIAFVSDGAAANRALYRSLSSDGANWWTVNPYAEDRKIFFICDAPHLLKTTRNCFSNSGSHKKTRLLWKGGKHIEWYHINKAYQSDLTDGIRTLINITDEHIHLTPCSLMKVKLAAQVLSRRMGNALRAMKCDEMSETIIYVETFNKWFDLMNVRNLREGIMSANDNVKPFSSATDSRLEWLTKDFIQYLDGWEKEVMERPGNFTKSERLKMLLSKETVEGLKATAHNIVSLTKFMLAEGAKFVLTYKFNQDPVELEFSKQRGAGGCNTNPSVLRYGDNTAKLKSMRIAKREIVYAGKGNISK